MIGRWYLHFLKARNGDARMSFFRAKFEQMQIEEMPTPRINKKEDDKY